MGTEARTRLAFGGVLAVTLLAFGQLFAGDDYVGPALLGAMAAVGISMLCRRLGAGPWLTLSVSLVGLTWYLCIVFQSDELLFGLPTLPAAAGIFNSLTRAANASSADFAPVPLRPGYVVMTVAGLWACAALGEIATFRWRRPLVASLGPISLVSFLLIIAQGSLGAALVVVFIVALLTYWSLESTHRLRSWGRWVGAWANREGDPDAVTGRVARRMGLGAVAAAIVAPMIVPAFGSGVLTWRTPSEGGPSNGAGGGLGQGEGGGAINPFVELQPKLLEQTEAEMFTVRAEAPSYWRVVSLSDFDGETWTQGDSETEALDDGVVPGPLDAESDAQFEQTFELTGLRGQFAPAAERPVEVTEGGDELKADLETQHLEALNGDVSDLTYTVRSVRPDLSFDELTGAEVGDLGDRQDDYLELPSDTDDRILDLADRWIDQAGASGAFESLVAIQDRFQTSGEFVYSDRVAPPDDPDGYLYRFLTESREGYCQQYATAFAVMARMLGYPTRVSVGYLPGSGDPDDEELFTVRGTHAHAWPEVYFEDHGWVTFEPTPRAISQPPAHTREPQTNGAGDQAGGNPFSNTDPYSGTSIGPDGRSSQPAGDGSSNCPAQLTQLECQTNIADPGAGADGRSLDDEFAWQQRFAVIWRAALVLLVLFLLLVPLLKEIRTKRRYARASSPSDVTAAAFSQFLDDASELTLERSPAESAIAYASRLGRRRMVNPLHADRLAQLFERAEYSAVGADSGQAAEAKRLAATLRRSMWRQASWWMRLRRLFSPTGLVAALRRAPQPKLRPRQTA